MKIFASKKSSLVQIDAAEAELRERERSINARLLEIRKGGVGAPEGPVRRRVSLTGSAAELAALDREIEELLLELREQIPARHAELRRRRDNALVEQARTELPGLVRELTSAADAHATALAAAAAAKATMDGLVDRVIEGRRRLKAAGIGAPTVEPKVIDQVAAARGLAESEGGLRFSSAIAGLYDQLADSVSPGKQAAERVADGFNARERERRRAEERPRSFLDRKGTAA